MEPKTTPNDIHAGQLLKNYIKTKKIAKSALARALNINPSTVISHTKSGSMKTDTLLRYCVVLKHNFFTDIAAMLPTAFTTTAPPDAEKDALIAALREEVKILKVERDLLKEVLGSTKKSQ